MGATRHSTHVCRSILTLVAFVLSACTASISSTVPSGTVATGTIAVTPASGSAGSANTGPATSTTAAEATTLNTPVTPTPQPTAPDRLIPQPEPSAFPGTDCGRIEMFNTRLVDSPTNAPALDCFWQTYQQCPTVGKAQLAVYQRFFETHTDRFFRLDGTSGSCVLTMEIQAFGLMANTPRTSVFTCRALTRDTDGLHFLGCGSEGDFTIPAMPISTTL